MASTTQSGPRVGVLLINGGRYAELNSSTRQLSVIDAKPEQKRSAKDIITEHVAELRRKSEQLVQRALAIEAELAVSS